MGSRREASVVVLVAVLVFAAQAAAFHGVRLDDAYVTFRYAQNLAAGHGLVFNPGERLLGTTSPGHALAGALLYAASGAARFPDVMSALGCAAWTAQAVCVGCLLREPLGRAGAAFVAAAIAVGASRAYFWVALETNLVAALVLVAFVLASRGRWLGCGVVAGLAVVFRADALVACLPLGVLALRDLRARTWQPVLAALAVGGAWFAFAARYFGSLLPHTFGAKVGRGDPLDYAVHAFVYPALSLAPGAVVPAVDEEPSGGAIAVAIVVWALAVAGAVLTVRRSRFLAGLAAYALLVTAAYVALHPDVHFTWHLYPTTLALAVFALAAPAFALSRVSLTTAAPIALAAVVYIGWAHAARFAAAEPSLSDFGVRDRLDRRVAEHLARVASLRDVVDAEEVGTLAYYAGLPMIDNAGLIADDAPSQLLAALAGRPSRVAWAVLNPGDELALGDRLAPFPSTSFTEGERRLTVYDLRSPPRTTVTPSARP